MTTENNVAAQAGDEPMREAFEAHIRSRNPKELFVARWPDGSYKHHGTDGMWAGWQAAMASQVSPRATADVERNLRAELINEGALRQYCHNDGSAGFVTAYDFDITNRFLAAIATTKPGA